jgi:misacylated tRNA(Ala) deacylase
VPSYLYHEQPDLYEFEARVVAARPGAVLLDRSALHPGGGGQVCDRATIEVGGETFQVTWVQADGEQYWHALDREAQLAPGDRADVRIDRQYRSRVAQLHTATHILNALVFQQFDGALVTGAQINGDGTARMDFDLPRVDNDLLRALEPKLNDVIRAGLEVRALYVSEQEARTTQGLIRSMSVAPPPTSDGRLRIIEIAGLDRQACGGTHLTNTGQCAPIAITKIENKGKQNRRVRIALVEPAGAS